MIRPNPTRAEFEQSAFANRAQRVRGTPRPRRSVHQRSPRPRSPSAPRREATRSNPLKPCAKSILDEAAARLKAHGRSPAPSEPDLQRAQDYFLTSWLGRNGVAGTSSYNQGFCRRFTKNGGHAATRFTSAVASIPAWRRRMRAVTILSECGIGLIKRIEDANGVVIYVDPPYFVKGADYVHDFTHDDHTRLALALRRFTRTRVVVSYYDHPRIAELYPGWTARRIEVT